MEPYLVIKSRPMSIALRPLVPVEMKSAMSSALFKRGGAELREFFARTLVVGHVLNPRAHRVDFVR